MRVSTTTPIRSGAIAGLLDLVVFQDLGPDALGLEDDFGGIADGAAAAGDGGDVVGDLFDFGAGIGDGDGEADAFHQDGVGQVIADEADLFGG